MITHADVAYVGSDRFDDARALVTQDHRSRALQCSVEVVVIAVAQPRRDGSNEDFTADWRVVLDIDEIELVGTVTKHSGAHRAERRRDYCAVRRWRGKV